MDPIYTPDNCRTAYQLNWAVSVFWRQPHADAPWLAELQAATEKDGVRILEHRFKAPDVSQFLVSTKPHVAPRQMVQSVKGRLQHRVRRQRPKAFRRNYAFRSMGSVRREVVEQYILTQHNHHPMADAKAQEWLARFAVARPEVDLSAARASAHARFWYNLHVVLANDHRWRQTDGRTLGALRDMILSAAAAKAHLLSRAAILPDHLHLALGCNLSETPLEVALGYMNNLAFACSMRPVFAFSLYTGTFGEYDLSVPSFWPARGDESALHGDRPRGDESVGGPACSDESALHGDRPRGDADSSPEHPRG